MYKFAKISAAHNYLRDDEIICISCSDINLGECVVLTAPPKVKAADLRYIQTSPVAEILENNTIDGVLDIKFRTESGSIYSIKEIV